VLIKPGSLVVVVYVEPELSVLVIMTGIRAVNPFESDTIVTVDGEPETVVVRHSVTGYASAMIEPD
jgi:hypothetical protein